DSGGEDDQGLADRENADHHYLLEDEREVLRLEEAVALPGEEHHREDQRDKRPHGRGSEHPADELAHGRGDPRVGRGGPRPGRRRKRPGRGYRLAVLGASPSSWRGRRRRSSTERRPRRSWR